MMRLPKSCLLLFLIAWLIKVWAPGYLLFPFVYGVRVYVVQRTRVHASKHDWMFMMLVNLSESEHCPISDQLFIQLLAPIEHYEYDIWLAEAVKRCPLQRRDVSWCVYQPVSDWMLFPFSGVHYLQPKLYSFCDFIRGRCGSFQLLKFVLVNPFLGFHVKQRVEQACLSWIYHKPLVLRFALTRRPNEQNSSLFHFWELVMSDLYILLILLFQRLMSPKVISHYIYIKSYNDQRIIIKDF